MKKLMLGVLVVVGCTETKNPAYCEKDVDCKNGKTCNLQTHGCELLVDAAPTDEDTGPLVARTVQQVRDPQTPALTPVELTNVIVTAVDLYGNRVGEFWVQDLGGGAGSGIKVYGAERSQVAVLAVGDIVDVSGGKKAHFTNGGDLSGRREIQVSPLKMLEVTKTGGTATPVVTEMDWVTISGKTGAELDLARDYWVGTLVRVTAIKAYEMPMALAADPTLMQFAVPAFHVQSLLTAFPGGIDAGTCFASITGVLEYNHNYYIQPRTMSDVVIGTGCL